MMIAILKTRHCRFNTFHSSYKKFSVACCILGLLGGCASNGVTPVDTNQLVEVEFVTVIKTEPVEFQSNVGKAATVGAVSGAIDAAYTGDSDEVVTSALAGAIFAALITRVEEGDNQGQLLYLKAQDQSTQQLIVRHQDFLTGDCLKLIKGSEVNATSVDKSLCQTRVAKSPH